jgi:glutamyl-tRNA reductase
MSREIVSLGVSHHSAPVEIREQLAISDAALETSLRELVALPHVDEGVIVSTCNRVEVTAATHDGEAALHDLVSFLARSENVDQEQIRRHLTVFRGADAVRHLFRVASSLDSMVVGEPQILGQLKDSYERAAASGCAGPILHRCFHKSFSVAKRVRTETAIASRAVSISSAAVELTGKIFDTLEDKTAMLIGAGTMSELAARHLLTRGVRSLIVTNRTYDRAVDLARDFRGTPVPFAEIDRYLPMADIIIGSTAAEDYVLTVPMVEQLLQRRKYRSVFLIDMSVPRNFDPGINELDDVYLYDIDDLSSVAESNRDEREREAARAEQIIVAEVDGFCRWLGGLEVVPTIVALRRKAEQIRQHELAKTLGTLRDLGEREQRAIDAMAAAIVNKLLHSPITRLKSEATRGESLYLSAARGLFEIEGEEEE